MGAPTDRELLARALDAMCDAVATQERNGRDDERVAIGNALWFAAQRLKLTAPVMFARSDMSCVSVITLTPKRRGWYQRTCFTRGCGATASDDLHPDLNTAMCRAWMLGYTLLVDRDCLSDYMPRA